ncbi:kinase-like protein [Punctularia strigosozonata HHB-11173 SS5]|uniref:kinase-like protein n=1 Tax=Punctularia strigosozonata (strain HHB-11173) TaxID=741275 RepID=UPI0004417BB5|nr:kinase-like protein [Punctularia strigosozonata HHB-11173 SS5]EIN08476.1 kinase-like protein [Punctularia strigosozonata HHB-11173 SS5]
MPSKPSTPPPALGTLIDNGALELVEILGYGGYGVVYRAVSTAPSSRYGGKQEQFAVKCLVHSQSPRHRQLHIREITLHRLASAHKNVVTLHRVIEDSEYTYIIMDYCPDGDLFAQILHQRRYLGYDALIKHVFLQLLDAVEHCHSLGIYHRDLKPENILCYDDGLRIGITDFGLATTDKTSQEFRTGSIYHMSPECQGGRFAPTGTYSPLFNDIWSLGIILLNLATGRNPWKSASLSDPTFHAYLQSPHNFLPTVLPISDELNDVLIRTLEVDWRKRITLRELRRQIRLIDSFYSEDAIFEGSMARCPWEAGVDLDSESEESDIQPADPPVQKEPEHARKPELKINVEVAKPAESEPPIQVVQEKPVTPAEVQSSWSRGSDSDMVFAVNSAVESDTTSWASVGHPTEEGEIVQQQQVQVSDWTDYSPSHTSWEEAHVRSCAPSPSSSKAARCGEAQWSTSPTHTISQRRSPTSTVPTIVKADSNPWSSTPSTTYDSSASESSESSPESIASLPVTPRATDAMSDSSSMNSLLIPPSSRRLTIDTAIIQPAYYGDDEGNYSPESSLMHTAVESLIRSPWASGMGPWTGAESFYVGSEASGPIAEGKTPVDLFAPRGDSALDIAMLDSESESDSDFDADDEDAEPRSATIASIRSMSGSDASSVPRSAITLDLAEATITDVEDTLTAASPMVISPRFDQAAGSQQLLALLSTPAVEPSKPSSSTSIIVDEVARSPQSGKHRPESKRRGSGRFNPIRMALRSLSPHSRSRNSRSSSRSSSTPRNDTLKPGASTEFAWTSLTLMTAHAPSPPDSSVVKQVFPQHERGRRPLRRRHNWFGSGKLFAAGAS